ncbi:hypothetical protein N180_00110 [Pedobacter antarcticus 4BY]|uniref:Uncharacterized protein n=3 Tax=Pedobacter antarcticus TaxID=34086 RepID=A0A081PBK5_9SPHI|nr:hypothetical protein N180_00110 [Pedobacter antarcticus 4BY]SFE41139.1 hypothetical protein SAMN03003324_00387 [Pedobacter antarcticus]
MSSSSWVVHLCPPSFFYLVFSINPQHFNLFKNSPENNFSKITIVLRQLKQIPKAMEESKNTQQHPDPTEEIQKNIETVTPDTEKDGKPNDQKNNNSPEETLSDDQEDKPIKNTEQDQEEPDAELPEDHDEENPEGDIETVSP